MCSTFGFLYAMTVPVITGALTPEEVKVLLPPVIKELTILVFFNIITL